MLYKIAHFLKDKLSWIWNIIEWINSILFQLRYGNKLEHISFSETPEGYRVYPIALVPTSDLVDFFAKQPEDAFTYFHPHKFDLKTLGHMQKNKSFLAYVLMEQKTGAIVGYCFNRCYFIGRGFRGRLVDIDNRGKGLGIAMNKLLNEVGFRIGIRLFETVSKDNIASFRSTLSASKVKIVKEMPNNELYLEIINE